MALRFAQGLLCTMQGLLCTILMSGYSLRSLIFPKIYFCANEIYQYTKRTTSVIIYPKDTPYPFCAGVP